MALGHRFHVDLDGHSVTVQFLARTGPFEVLVDGKVVGYGKGPGASVAAELPGDPPRPFTVTVGHARVTGGVPSCVLQTGGVRRPVPHVPLGTAAAPAGPPRPVRRLRRSLRRRVRGLMGRR
ncbi:hypothetical protein [Streptomyces sp. NPDC015131]|uniref:hypothetical protein n=1 Tax=Streptomyces sp. NPDC015131 TaxID=3364941 RepID=UPI0036F6E6D9